ncbi:hypothetical protein [Oryzobacter terrae]|uniref:hypothetical protein n=1 Tax=Oryzobacter terrae TaxID=1620385 RepID=UPI00366CFCC4
MTQWREVVEGVTVALGGDRVRGRVLLEEAWDGTDDAHGAQRCVIAHYLADVQDDLADEVAWDERALAAFDGVSDADLAPVGIERAAAMAPSLHLNLGDGYLRQGRVEDAEAQLALARQTLGALGADGYGDLVRRGVNGLGERVAAALG